MVKTPEGIKNFKARRRERSKAVRVTPDNLEELKDWMVSHGCYSRVVDDHVLVEYDPDNVCARAYPGDWIIYGDGGFDVRSAFELSEDYKEI